MAAPYNDLSGKLEEAAKSLVDALAVSGLTVLAGQSIDEVAAPYALCNAENGSGEVILDTGLVTVSLIIEVVSNCNDQTNVTDHRALVAQVFDVFFGDTVEALLSAEVTDFHVYDVHRVGTASEVQSDKFVSQLTLDVVLCAIDVS